MTEQAQTQEQKEMSDEEALLELAKAMKDNAPSQDEKHNVHTFLFKVVQEDNIKHVARIGNLRDDKEMNELGHPTWSVRGALEMAHISEHIMENEFFTAFFQAHAMNTLITSLSRNGFLIRQATTQTKQVADITKRRKTQKGFFKKREEVSGGDTTQQGGQQE